MTLRMLGAGLLVAALMLPKTRAFADQAPRPAPLKIVVDRKSHGFVDSSGARFVPFGVTYYRPGTGWAPQVWKQFDPPAIRKDFALLKQHGANVVRVFISFRSFMPEPDRLDPAALVKFDQFLDLADEAGLYVHPTGPDAWEGMPAWTQQMDALHPNGDPKYLDALERFWRAFAGRYKGRSTLWAYDLKNEPEVAWTGQSLSTGWEAWRMAHHEPAAPIPDPKSMIPVPALLDFQHYRESLADEWVARQAKVIHEADPDALVTVGLIQWSVPAQRLLPSQYSGFRPAQIAKYLDFMELHYYPLAGVSPYAGDEAEARNLSVLESMAREAAKPGLPLVISEFGWAGGGEFNGATCTEAQQAHWCERLIETTSPLACGWLNWGMYDTPQANDVSKLTGLFRVDGEKKVWATSFAHLSEQLRREPPTFTSPVNRPDMKWDQCIAEEQAMESFRVEYFKALKSTPSKPGT